MDPRLTHCYVQLKRLLPSQIPEKRSNNLGVSHSSPKHKQSTTSKVTKNKFKCVICQKLFKNRFLLENHLRRHTNERPYKCTTCTKYFKTSNHLKRHERVHPGEKPYPCSKCSSKFSVSSTLKSHIETKHKVRVGLSTKKKAQCPVCNRVLSNRSQLLAHSKIHSDIKQFSCVICEHRSRSLRSLMSHISVHTKEYPYHCDQCPAKFNQSQTLKAHSQMVHKKEGWDKHKCTFCPKAYHAVSHLNRHLKSHSLVKKPQFLCHFCDTQRETEYSLKVHLRTHTKPFSCPICLKKFAQFSQLSTHKLRHTGERPFSCSECPVRFISKRHLNIHVRAVHKMERHFACAICGKSFSRGCSRNIHFTTHFNERPCKCELCGRRFVKSSLSPHLKKHDVTSDSKCVVCPKRFLSRLEMLQHYLNVHVGSDFNLLECVFCNEVLKGLKPLEIHVSLHTGERPYACSVCDKPFRLYESMNGHKYRIHEIKTNDKG